MDEDAIRFKMVASMMDSGPMDKNMDKDCTLI